ncbi:MAG: lipopolysaccharide assembly protein LapB, partial [Gammaproteobacteria bacterium]
MEPFWFYLLLALLPVAAWSGWMAARAARRDTHRPTRSGYSPEYFKGLNYLLNEQPDKAIEVFVKMVEVDSETIETHLALGSLFRRRGEVDRAIRIHQNLIARPTLTDEQRALAVLELAMDYMRSGLLDRAEELFKLMIATNNYTDHALQGLLDIYQQEQDWENAITIAGRLQPVADATHNAMIAQFYCEQARQLIDRDRLDEAGQMTQQALHTDPGCVRASLMQAKVAERAGELEDAVKWYQHAAEQSPDYITEILQPLYHCYQQLNQLPEFKRYLQTLYQQYGGVPSLLLLTRLYDELEGEAEATRFIVGELERHPTVGGVDKLIEYVINKADGDIRNSLQAIKGLTGKLLVDGAGYQCTSCGYNARTLY